MKAGHKVLLDEHTIYSYKYANNTGLGARIFAVIDMIAAILYISYTVYFYKESSSYENLMSTFPHYQRSDKEETRIILFVLDISMGVMAFLIGMLLFQGSFRRKYRLVETWLIVTALVNLLTLAVFGYYIYTAISTMVQPTVYIVAVSVYFLYKSFSMWSATSLLKRLSSTPEKIATESQILSSSVPVFYVESIPKPSRMCSFDHTDLTLRSEMKRKESEMPEVEVG